jgi:hypothetical protein
MSDKVVALPGAKLPDGSVPKNIVEAIEEVLVEARAGRVAAVGLAWVTPQGVIHQITANSGLPTAHQMVAAACYLIDTCKREIRD